MPCRPTLWCLLVITLATALTAADGPPPVQPTYSSGDLWKVQWRTGPEGTTGNNNQKTFGTVDHVLVHRGYLIVPTAEKKTSEPDAGIYIYELGDPRAPKLVQTVRNNNTAKFVRGHHGFGVDDRGVTVMRDVNGVQTWNINNPLNPQFKDRWTESGLKSNGYDDGMWHGFSYGHLHYAAMANKGLYVFDLSNQSDIKRVKKVERSVFGADPDYVYAIGNLLVAYSHDNGNMWTFDISDPTDPKRLDKDDGVSGYSGFFYAGQFHVCDGTWQIFNISNNADRTFSKFTTISIGDKPQYMQVSDDNIFVGTQNSFSVYDLSDWLNGTKTLRGTGPSKPLEDHDFAYGVGNTVLVTSDETNKNGSAWSYGMISVPWTTTKDTVGPKVVYSVPANGQTDYPVTAAIGLNFNDNIDMKHITASNIVIRKAGGAVVPGAFSFQMNIMNFVPDAPLEHGTTYEVVVKQGGVKDWVGNAIGSNWSMSFTTEAGDVPVIPLAGTPQADAPQATGQAVSFNVADAQGTGALEFRWSYGDGSQSNWSTNGDATHTYADPGHYVARLEIRDANGSIAKDLPVTIHRPLTAGAPRHSSTIVFNAGTQRVYNVNPDNDTVTAINTATLAKVWERPVAEDPRSIALRANGELWITAYDADVVTVLDASGISQATIALPYGARPAGIVIDDGRGVAYVAGQGRGAIYELSLSGRSLTRSLAVGVEPRALALSHDGTSLLVTRLRSPTTGGLVTRVDTAAWAVDDTVTLAIDTAPDSELNGRGLPNYLTGVTISPDGQRAWVPSKKDNIQRGTARDGLALQHENSVRAIVSQINLGTWSADLAERKDIDNSDSPTAVVFSPLGDFALVALQGSNRIEALDAYSMANAGSVTDTGLAPQGLVLDDQQRLFVHAFLSREVRVFNVADLLAGNGSASKIAEIAVVSNEALTAMVKHGKQIFYNSADPRMAGEFNYMACATCHLDGGHDGVTWDFTDRGEGFRNTTSLRGRRGTGHGPVHWTANFDEIHDFENDIRGGFGGDGFLTDTQFNATSATLGSPKAGLSADLDALAAYVTSLDSYPRSPHRQDDGSLTAAATAGRALFKQLDCAQCHSGTDFTDSGQLVRHDVGTIVATSGKRLGATLDGIDTPTLRGLWNTAPYFHDGSAATIAAVISRGGASHGNMNTLSATEQAQLAAYLLSLDGSSSNPGRPNPNTPPVIDSLTAAAAVSTATLQLTASDGDGDSLQFTWVTDDQPDGSAPGYTTTVEDPLVTFDMVGTYRFTVTVSDGQGGTAIGAVTVVIDPQPTSIVISP